MQKHFRIMVLTGALAFAAPCVFASGPGDGDPPPTSVPPTTASTAATSTSAVTTETLVSLLLGYLGL